MLMTTVTVSGTHLLLVKFRHPSVLEVRKPFKTRIPEHMNFTVTYCYSYLLIESKLLLSL
jgi:hypothetical protein